MARESEEARRLREYRENVSPNLRAYAKPEHSRKKRNMIRLLYVLGAKSELLQELADASEEKVEALHALIKATFDEYEQKKEEESQ